MLFVGYGAPSSPSRSHHPSTSAPIRTIRPLSLSSDAIEADLRSLYSQALRLQNTKQHTAALALYRRILSHKAYHHHRAQHSSSQPQSRYNGQREEDGGVEGADRGLEQLWRLTWRNVGDLFQSDGQPHIALHCYHTALASHHTAYAASSAATIRPLLLSLSRAAVQVGQLALARRTLESALVRGAHEADGGEWDVIDSLVDVLYCIGDHHTLTTLLEGAVLRDSGYVKGLLLYSQLYAASPASLSLSAAVYSHCQRQLQHVPRSHARAVTKQLLQLAATQRSLVDAALSDSAPSEQPSTLHRNITVSAPSPLTSFATSLLALHNELTHAQKHRRKLTQTADTLTVHQLLRLMKERSKQTAAMGEEQAGVDVDNDGNAVSRMSSTASVGSASSAQANIGTAPSTQSLTGGTSSSSISTHTLAIPLVLTLSTTDTVSTSHVAIDEKRDEKRDEDVEVVEVSDDSKDVPIQRVDKRLAAAVQYAQVAVGDDIIVDELTLSFDHPSLPPLPTVLTASQSPHASSARPSLSYSSSEADSLLSSFVSQHASNAFCNSGCVDVMQRYLRWLRESSMVGADSVMLARLVDVVTRCHLLSTDDVDELLFCGEVVLDARSSYSGAPSNTTASTLSSLTAQLSLLAVSAAALSVAQRVRFSHLRAHRLLIDSDVPAAVHQLQSTIELLSAHPALSPIHLPHCSNLESISPSSLQSTVERLKALQLLHELFELTAASAHTAIVDAFMLAYSVEPVCFEQRLLALSDADRQRLMSIVLHAAEAEKSASREWQVRRIEGRLLAAQLVAGVRTKETVADKVRGWCERVLSLFTSHSTSYASPKREEVLDLLRALTVSLSLLVQPSSVDQLDVQLTTAINKLATYYHIGTIPLSPSSPSSSAFLLYLSLLVSSHCLLACVDGCHSAAGRKLLSTYLDSLFHNRHLRLHEHHSISTLLPLLPPLPACFMPTSPQPPISPLAPSSTEPASMVLSEASRLLSDLCDLFSPFYPSHLSDKSHCAAHKDEMLSSSLWRARLLHLLGSHLLKQYELTGSVAVAKEMRESILACLEQLAAYTPRPTVPSTSFITAYLAHPPSLSLASSFALVPNTPVVWGDELTTTCHRFHGHYILPAYIQRVNEADDWFSNASYRREWENEQSLLSSLTTLCLLSNPTSPYLWYSLALLHWEPAQRELSSAYAELCIDPLHLTRQQGERAGKRREEEERVRASGWVEKVNRCTRCFLYCLHLLRVEFGSDATLRRIFEADDDRLADAEASRSAGEEARPDSMDKRLVLIVWEKLAFLAYRLAQMMQYLPFLRGEEAAVSAIRVIPPQFTRRRTPSPVSAAGTAVDMVAVDELRVSYSCFRVAARLAPRHWVVEYMMGKLTSKLDRMPHNYIRHFQTAADLCFEQWKQQKERQQSTAEPTETREEKEEVEMEADTVAADEMEEAGEVSVQDGDTEDEDAEEEECRMNVYPLYRLHSWRLKLAEHLQRLATQSSESEAGVTSVEVSRGKLPVWTEVEREEALIVLEASSFIPPTLPSSLTPTAPAADDVPCVDLLSSTPNATSVSLSATTAAIVTRCEAVVSNVVLAMQECVRRDSRCYSALIKLAHIHLDRHSTKKLRWLADRLQPFAHYARSKPLNKFDKTDTRSFDTELHAFSAHPRQLDWWQYTPWRGCAGYFKCLERYLQLLVRLRSTSGFLSLYTLVSLARRLPDLPAIKRLHVYGQYLLQLLERLASDGAEGDAAGSGAASEYELLCQRACEVCVQLHDQNIHMQRLLVLAYVVQRQRTRQVVAIDAVNHADVRKWLMEQRWARRINVGDLIGGSVEKDKSDTSAGSKRRREDDSGRQGTEQTEATGSVEHRDKRMEVDTVVPSPDAVHNDQPAADGSQSSTVGMENSNTDMADADNHVEPSVESPAHVRTTPVPLLSTLPLLASDAESSSGDHELIDDVTVMQPADDTTVELPSDKSEPAMVDEHPTTPPTFSSPPQPPPPAISSPLVETGNSGPPAEDHSADVSSSFDVDVIVLDSDELEGRKEEEDVASAAIVQQVSVSSVVHDFDDLPPLE